MSELASMTTSERLDQALAAFHDSSCFNHDDPRVMTEIITVDDIQRICVTLEYERDSPQDTLRGLWAWPDTGNTDWLVHFFGWGAASSQVTLRYREEDQYHYSTLTWKRSAWPHSFVRAISDLIETQQLFRGGTS